MDTTGKKNINECANKGIKDTQSYDYTNDLITSIKDAYLAKLELINNTINYVVDSVDTVSTKLKLIQTVLNVFLFHLENYSYLLNYYSDLYYLI